MSKTNTQLTYEMALKELQEIVAQLQDDAIGMDELSEKIKRSAELINFCREKLRTVEGEVKGLFEV
jgi:exodeoxyribonuclease VII small subunit